MDSPNKQFKIYKGLQMPLVFKTLKGKYIYWTLGTFIGSFVACALVSVLTSIVIGLLVMIAIDGVGAIYILKSQKKGLYKKNNEQGIFIIKSVKI